jgi:hypothetical protein
MSFSYIQDDNRIAPRGACSVAKHYAKDSYQATSGRYLTTALCGKRVQEAPEFYAGGTQNAAGTIHLPYEHIGLDHKNVVILCQLCHEARLLLELANLVL